MKRISRAPAASASCGSARPPAEATARSGVASARRHPCDRAAGGRSSADRARADCHCAICRSMDVCRQRAACCSMADRRAEARSACCSTGDRRAEARSVCRSTGDRRAEARSACCSTGDRRAEARSVCRSTGDRRAAAHSACRSTADRRAAARSACCSTADRRAAARSVCWSTGDRRAAARSVCRSTGDRRAAAHLVCCSTADRRAERRSACCSTADRFAAWSRVRACRSTRDPADLLLKPVARILVRASRPPVLPAPLTLRWTPVIADGRARRRLRVTSIERTRGGVLAALKVFPLFLLRLPQACRARTTASPRSRFFRFSCSKRRQQLLALAPRETRSAGRRRGSSSRRGAEAWLYCRSHPLPAASAFRPASSASG